MLLEFVKMQGAGNDYLFFDGFEQEIKEPEKLARRLSVRAVSVGGDGIILILPPSVTGADARMRIFNADGSEAQMCGNGVRCAAKFLCEERGIGRDVLLIETLAGIRRVEVKREGGVVKRARVAMGRADFCLSHVTNSAEGEEMIHREVCVKSSRIRLSALSMGNPHAVSFWEEIEGLDLVHIGPAIEHHPLFSEGVNAEFVRVHSPTLLEVRVWERGSGGGATRLLPDGNEGRGASGRRKTLGGSLRGRDLSGGSLRECVPRSRAALKQRRKGEKPAETGGLFLFTNGLFRCKIERKNFWEDV